MYDTEEDSQITARNTLAFLGEWLCLLRHGQDITQTPMGYVCQGWQLRSDHPFFTRRLINFDILNDSYTFQPNNESESNADEDADSGDDDFGFSEEEWNEDSEKDERNEGIEKNGNEVDEIY